MGSDGGKHLRPQYEDMGIQSSTSGHLKSDPELLWCCASLKAYLFIARLFVIKSLCI